jgi:glycogen debranching enzyme
MREGIRVGPPRLTLHHGTMVLVTNHSGEIRPKAEEGLFYHDTRFLSQYNFIINGQPWLTVQSTRLGPRANRLHFTNSELRFLDGPLIPPDSIEFRVDREVANGMRERLLLRNNSSSPVSLRLRIRIDADFADLFDVHSHNFLSRGVRDSYWDEKLRRLVIRYKNRDFERAMVYQLNGDHLEPHFSNGQILFSIELAPGEPWFAENLALPVIGRVSQTDLGKGAEEICFCAADPALDTWKESTTRLESSNYSVRMAYEQAIHDIGSLRIHEHDYSRDIWVPAAGVPWFAALFGRDSLVVSYQDMLVSPELAIGTLSKLAELQAKVDDPFRDAEPGKIMHELRVGELAHFGLIPHTPYYGTADATILYLIVLSQLLRWTGDIALTGRFLETARRCLEWIDKYGDRDGDGFQEYKTRSEHGYRNQGWKDSGDSVVYPDGRLVDPPIALCELQGFVYDAKLRMAELFELQGDRILPDRLRGQAQDLRRRFHQAFWLPQNGFIAYCLDAEKKPVATIASNPGHCLASGIVEPIAARIVAERLFQEDMWSGWGIRTLSSDNPAYNPFGYQRGAVWPHDNGFIAAGLHRYGFREQANRIAGGILDAASYFELYRLPELFAGLSRTDNPFPVQYIYANTPQAWASGSIFHLLRTMLGINPVAHQGRLYLDPALPEWLDDVTLRDLRVGPATLSLRFKRAARKSSIEVLSLKGGRLDVRHETPPWLPNSVG